MDGLFTDDPGSDAFTKAIQLDEDKDALPMVELTRARLASVGA